MNIYEQVEKNIDELVEKNVYWSACATAKEMKRAKEGDIRIKFFDKEIPSDWLKNVKGKKSFMFSRCRRFAGAIAGLCRSGCDCIRPI